NSNGKLVQIVLAGQPELDEKLRQPELRQFRQRIGARCRLPLLTLEETEEYVTSRIRTAGSGDMGIFSGETVQLIYSYAHGIPRVINLLCEKSLLAAYADHQNKVSPANVKHAASEMDLAYEPAQPRNTDTAFGPSILIPLEAPKTEPVRPQVAASATPYPPLVPPAHMPAPVQLAPAAVPEARPKPNVRVFTPKPAIPEQPVAQSAFASPPNAAIEPPRRPESAFRRYWSEVARSFIRDCK